MSSPAPCTSIPRPGGFRITWAWRMNAARERGEGSNINIPLPPGSADAAWLEAVDALVSAARAHESEALVVALGVDAAAGDPESPLAVSEDGYREAGRLLAGPGVPTVVVQEGGYDLATIGSLVLATLEGFTEV
jgi:acetoin utilization deacetylase AcuC-like enzyme